MAEAVGTKNTGALLAAGVAAGVGVGAGVGAGVGTAGVAEAAGAALIPAAVDGLTTPTPGT